MAGAFNIGAVVAEIKADLTNFEKGIKAAQAQTKGLRNAMSKTASAVADFGKQSAILTGVVGAGVGVVAKKALDMAGNFEQSEIAFTTLLKDREKAIAAIKAIEEDAKSTPYNLPDLIKANQLLVSAGVNTEDARGQIKDLGNAIAATGGGTAELNRLAANLQQIKAVGKASAVDIKQFAFAGINVYELLAQTTGKTVAEVKEMDVSYELLTEAFADASKEGGMFEGAMENQSKSLQGVISNLQDVIGLTLKDIAVNSGLFDAIKRGAEGSLGYIEQITPNIIGFFQNLGTKIQAVVDLVTKNDFMGFVDAFNLPASDAMLEFIDGFLQKFRILGDWINENQELIFTFLQGLAIGFGALLIIGTITGLITALFNPMTLAVLAVAGLFTAWQTNFWGIRDITMNVITWMVNFWNNYLFPAISAVRQYFIDNWDQIKTHLDNTMSIIKGVIQIAWAVIEGIFKVGLAVISGDWGQAWTAIKEMLAQIWEGIKNILSGALGHLKSWGSNIYDTLTKPFRDAWETIKGLMEKIRDGLDFTKRHSPSVMDIINKSVRLANNAMGNLDFDVNPGSPQKMAAAVAAPSAGGITQISLNFDGAIISSDAAAEEMAEAMGDKLIRILERNLRV